MKPISASEAGRLPAIDDSGLSAVRIEFSIGPGGRGGEQRRDEDR
jgi:hypothetical protein